MVSFENKQIMLSTFMLIVIMLSVVMLNVLASVDDAISY